MADIVLDVDDDLLEAIRVKAAQNGRSVEEEARAYLIARFSNGAEAGAAQVPQD